MNREEFIRVAIQVSTWEKGTIPFRAAFDQLIAEFDRLTAENEKLKATPVAKLYVEAVADRFELLGKLHQAQAQLDKICEMAQPSLGFIGARLAAADLRQQGWEVIPAIFEAIADYLDSQKLDEAEG